MIENRPEINWSRIIIMLALLISLAFNYIYSKDNRFLQHRYDLIAHNFLDDFIGYDYCDR